MNQHRGCRSTGAVPVPDMDRHRGWSCTGDSTGLGSGVPGLCRERGPAPAPGPLLAGAPGHGATARGVVAVGVTPAWIAVMGVWPVGGYQPQSSGHGGYPGVTICGADREPREPLALGPDRCVAYGNCRTPSHPGMHLPGPVRALSIRPHLLEPLCGCQSPGAPGLGHGVSSPGPGLSFVQAQGGSPDIPSGS